MNTLGQRIPHRTVVVGEVEVDNVVNHLAAEFVRNVLIKETIACFYVMHGNEHPLRDDGSDGKVGVSRDYYRVGFPF